MFCSSRSDYTIFFLLRPDLARIINSCHNLTGRHGRPCLECKEPGCDTGWPAVLSLPTSLRPATLSCRFILRNIRRIRPFLTQNAAQVLVQTFVISRLDYCNWLLAGVADVPSHPCSLSRMQIGCTSTFPSSLCELKYRCFVTTRACAQDNTNAVCYSCEFEGALKGEVYLFGCSVQISTSFLQNCLDFTFLMHPVSFRYK